MSKKLSEFVGLRAIIETSKITEIFMLVDVEVV